MCNIHCHALAHTTLSQPFNHLRLHVVSFAERKHSLSVVCTTNYSQIVIRLSSAQLTDDIMFSQYQSLPRLHYVCILCVSSNRNAAHCHFTQLSHRYPQPPSLSTQLGWVCVCVCPVRQTDWIAFDCLRFVDWKLPQTWDMIWEFMMNKFYTLDGLWHRQNSPGESLRIYRNHHVDVVRSIFTLLSGCGQAVTVASSSPKDDNVYIEIIALCRRFWCLCVAVAECDLKCLGFVRYERPAACHRWKQ